jgi:hypothetical protein
MDYSSVFVE